VNKYKNGKVEGVYFDPYGVAPPTDVEEFVGSKSLTVRNRYKVL
jgi:hypothetical protein